MKNQQWKGRDNLGKNLPLTFRKISIGGEEPGT